MIDNFNFDDATLRSFIEYSVIGETLSPWHITRYAMYRDLSNVLASHDSNSKLAASISYSQQMAVVTGITQAQFVNIDYPEFNVMNLPFNAGTFDFAFADVVFEHIEGNPWNAYKEISRVLKPGGFIVLSTAFMFPFHPCPGDFWRFTESGLRIMAAENGHSVIRSGCWGNLQAFILDRLGCSDVKIPENPQHPLYKLATTTDPNWPVVVWLVAQKAA